MATSGSIYSTVFNLKKSFYKNLVKKCTLKRTDILKGAQIMRQP